MLDKSHPLDEHFVKQKLDKITKHKPKYGTLWYSHNLAEARIALLSNRRLTERNTLCVQAFGLELS
jgi:hypothetical protein